MKNTSIIQVEKLVKTYSGKNVVNGVSFDVMEGEIFGILGPNGAGKSTILEMIETLRKIDSGKVTLDGIDVAKDPKKVKKIIGIQLQNTAFMEKLNLNEQLRMFASFYGVSINTRALLESVNLLEHAKKYPEQLSGG